MNKLPALPLDLDNSPARMSIHIKAGELVTVMHQWGHAVYAAGQQASTEDVVAWQNRHAPDHIVEGKYAPDASNKWVPLGYVLTRQAAPEAATSASATIPMCEGCDDPARVYPDGSTGLCDACERFAVDVLAASNEEDAATTASASDAEQPCEGLHDYQVSNARTGEQSCTLCGKEWEGFAPAPSRETRLAEALQRLLERFLIVYGEPASGAMPHEVTIARAALTPTADEQIDAVLSGAIAHARTLLAAPEAPALPTLDAILNCYSPDDTVSDYQDKIRALFDAPAATSASQHAEQKCTCVYATSENTDSVRKGFEMGGYLKHECEACKAAPQAATSASDPDIYDAVRDYRDRHPDVVVDAPLSNAEFLAKRLARVAKLAGVRMPSGTYEQIAEVAGTILGEIARALSCKNEDVLRFAIEVEKELCVALGREWSASGISIESLIEELAARARGTDALIPSKGDTDAR